jgi:two-component system OmpR family sensor kinase
MVKSIRGRLQLWYAAVLLAVVVGFAVLLYYRVRASRLQEIDASIESAARYLDASLRSFPPHLLEPGKSDPPPPPKKKGKEPPRRPPEQLLADLDPPAEAGAPERPYFGVWRADGSLVKSRDLPAGAGPPERPPPPSRLRIETHGDSREAVLAGHFGTRVRVGRPIGRVADELRAFAWQLAGAGVAVLTLGLAGGWWIASRLFRPVTRMAEAAAAISASSLDRRIDVGASDLELAELARVLNATFDRLQLAFERQARFTADASHELRTPLAIVRAQAQLALDRPRGGEEYREALAACLRAADRMAAVVEALLTLARAGADDPGTDRQPVDLAELVADVVDQFRALAAGKQVTLTVELGPVQAEGDPAALARVVGNLLANAIQYNRPGGSVTVRLSEEKGSALLSVADTGCGIPAADRELVFERFYRADKARSRASGGTGLGLAICKSIIAAHGGTIEFDSVEGEGTTFRVRLPLHEAAQE